MRAEIGDLSRFQNPRELMGYLGLVPSEDTTGGVSDEEPRPMLRRLPLMVTRSTPLRDPFGFALGSTRKRSPLPSSHVPTLRPMSAENGGCQGKRRRPVEKRKLLKLLS